MIYKGVAFLIGTSSLLIIANVQYAIFFGLLSLLLILLNLLFFKTSQLSKIFLLGVLWACTNVYLWTNYAVKSVSEPRKALITGYICSIPEWKYERFQFDFCVADIDGVNIKFGQLDRFKFSWGRYAPQPPVELEAGQYWRFQAKLKPPFGRYNEGGVDYQKWMLAQGYAGTGKIRGAPELLSNKGLLASFHTIRQNAYRKLTTLLPDERFRGMLIALAMGERGGINQQQWEALKHSGTSHLLAISGLHIGVAALWSYWLVLAGWRLSQRLCLMIPAQQAAEVGSLIGGLSMLLLSGLGLPAQRAFLMLVIFIFSRWSGRYYQLTSVLGIAIIAILLLHPFAVLSASFWLSFLAVFIISIVINRQFTHTSKLTGWLNLNWYLYLAMIPISAIFFNMLSIVSFIANLVLIPLTSFVLIPVLYLAMLLTILSDYLANLLFHLASQIIAFVHWVQLFLANLNMEFFDVQLNDSFILLMLVVFCLLLLPKYIISKAIYLPILLLLAFSYPTPNKREEFEMVVFDIGQGLAIYIETDEGNLLFDVGWGNNQYALASSTIIPFLDSRNINSIDKLIISHGDSDHAGGISQILKHQQINEVLTGEAVRDVPSVSCHDYKEWQWGSVKFEFLAHLSSQWQEGNNASCVLSIITPHGGILLTGDIEKRAEKALLNKVLTGHDVVVAPHHGSETSSTEAFVSRLLPREVIFSTGYDNQWNFPRQKVIERYQGVGARTWTTHQDGAIRVTFNKNSNGLVVISLRQENPHFWL